jgi:putative endonuclease
VAQAPLSPPPLFHFLPWMDQEREKAVDNVELGRLGEEEAVRFLKSRGWTILERNVRSGRREVDIIASRGRVVAFVEVKCRRNWRFGHPLEAITRVKRLEIARVARSWLYRRALPPGTLVRFDAIAVSWPRGSGPEVLHLPDAWRLS